MLRPPFRLKADAKEVALKLFAINDAEELLGHDWVVDVQLLDSQGNCFGELKDITLAEPPLGGGLVEREISLPVRPGKIGERSQCFFKLKARAGKQAGIAENRYEVDLFAAVGKPKRIEAGLVGSNPGGDRFSQLMLKAGCELKPVKEGQWPQEVVAISPDKAEWGKLVEHARTGGRVLVIDPADLPPSPAWGGAEIKKTDWAGETANFTLSGNREGLSRGLLPRDLAWWENGQLQRMLFKRAILFKNPVPESVRPLVEKTQPHGYGPQWRMLFPVVEFSHGSGSITVSLLDANCAERDPAAAQFFKNLLETLK